MNKTVMFRAVRVVLGAVLVGLAATQTIAGWGWLGMLPLVSGLLGICPACSLGGCAVDAKFMLDKAFLKRC